MSGREETGSVFLGDLGGNIRRGSVLVGIFSRRGLYGKELPGKELSAWGYCPGENCMGGVYLGAIYRSPPRAGRCLLRQAVVAPLPPQGRHFPIHLRCSCNDSYSIMLNV